MSETPARDIVDTPNNNTRNEIVSHGLEILKWSVLDVLYQERNKNFISQRTICKHLGIRKNNHLIRGILYLLKEDNYVNEFHKSCWNIREEGINRIES